MTADVPERHHTLTVPTDPVSGVLLHGGLPIQPGLVVKDALEFEVDAPNMRAIEESGSSRLPLAIVPAPPPTAEP